MSISPRVYQELSANILAIVRHAKGEPWKGIPQIVWDHLWPLDYIHTTGVYFLGLEGALVYIGTSGNVHTRLGEHLAAGKLFDEVLVMCSTQTMERPRGGWPLRGRPRCDYRAAWMERYLIWWLRPRYNVVVHDYHSYRFRPQFPVQLSKENLFIKLLKEEIPRPR